MSFLPAAGLVMILVGVGSYYATRSLHGLSWYSGANLLLGVSLLALGAAVQARRFRGFSGAESLRVALRWLGISAGSLLAVIGIDVALRNNGARLDLTVGRSYTLSDQTRAQCQELAQKGGDPIQLVFFEDSILAKDVRLLVDAYKSACPTLQLEDASHRAPPEAARQLYTTNATTVVACRGDVCDPVGYPSERNITSAIVRLARERTIRVYFLVGHGEVDFASDAATGYSGMATLLHNEGLEARALVGPATAEIPDDADLLVVAAPERDLLPEELDVLERYLARGGRMLALTDPSQQSNFYSALLPRWGFAVGDGVVLDAASSPLLRDPKPVNLLIHRFAPYNPVTRALSQRTMVLFPRTRQIKLTRKPQSDDQLEQAAFASARSWVSKDLAAALAGRDTAAPPDYGDQEIAVVVTGRYPRADDTKKTSEARIVVIGNRDFASNRLLDSLYNSDLLMSAVRWLAADEEHIALADKGWTPNQDPLTVQQTVASFYFMAFALPEGLLLLGLLAWWRQRT
jgi:ABC-type uncharacterized transport system involved in gliding motility auxiliary subunit